MSNQRTVIPGAKDVRDVLEGMLGRDVEVTSGGAMVNPGSDGGALVGVYVDRLKLTALVLLDLPLAAYVGAAIGLVPATAAKYAIEDAELPQALFDNAAEILNVMSSVFNTSGAPHLRLDRSFAPGEPLPGDIAPWPLAFVPRLDLSVTVKSYGQGSLSVLVL
jgi:hypothetical protein